MTAKEMFENLGYSLEVDNDYLIKYSKDDYGYTTFNFNLVTKKFHSNYKSIANSITLDEFKAVIQQYKELGWLEKEQKQETNLEHYYDDLLKEGSWFAFANGEIKNCDDMHCNECIFDGRCRSEERIKWLASPYKKSKYRLTQFEYDVLRANGMSHDKKLSSFATYKNLKKLGYFKDIDFELTINEILNNFEVIENEKS